jgi:hypothetical protein
MLQNAKLFEAWERQWVQSHPINFMANFRTFEALYQEARTLGILPLKNPLDGLSEKITFAKALNVRKAA